MAPYDWNTIRQNIFAGESGGDYDALFGYSNRPGRQFEGTRLTDMTVDQALDFANPSGAYGQWVKGQVGRVATPMGAYQVVGTTLRDAKRGLGLRGDEKMTPDLQDRIGRWIYEKQGTGAWEGYKPDAGARSVAADTMQALGKGKTMTPMVPTAAPQQERKGFLGGLLSDPDLMDRLAIGFAGMTLNPNTGLQQLAASRIASRAEERKAGKERNATAEWLRSQGAEQLASGVMSGAVPASTALSMYQVQAKAAQDPNVQSSTMLRDNSGTILTMRDGSTKVVTVGGETLSGQAAVDYVRQSNERYAETESKVYGARRGGALGAELEMGGAVEAAKTAGTEMTKRAFDAYDKAMTANQSIGTINEAIAAIDGGAQSGLVYNMLPNVTEASAALNNAMNRMGLDVISSVTFGALSEGEMKLAMETAVPRNLAPAELRSWLVKKADAQAKARDALVAAARYLSTPGNTLQGWLDQQGGAGKTTAPAATVKRQRYDQNGNLIND